MTSRSIDHLHPALAYAYGRAVGQWPLLYPDAPTPFLTCTYRDNADQQKLFDQPTDKKDNDGDGKIDEADEKVTNARPGESAHNYLPALALDVAFKDQLGAVDWSPRLFADFAQLVKQTTGITWGGNFKTMIDRPHFELTNWKELAK